MSDNKNSESGSESDADESIGSERGDSGGSSQNRPSRSEYADYHHLARHIRRDSESPKPDDTTDTIIASRPRVISAALRALIAAFPLAQDAMEPEHSAVIPEYHADRAVNALLRAQRIGTYKHRQNLLRINWKAVDAAFEQDQDERLSKALSPLRCLLEEPSSVTVTMTNVFAHRTAVLQKALNKAKLLDASKDLLADHKRPPRPKRGRPKSKEPVSKKRKLQPPAAIT